MKKIIGLLFVLIIAAGAGAYLYFTKPLAIQATPAQLLPADTLMMVEARELKQTIDQFRKGPLGQALARIDLKEAGRELDADPDQMASLISALDQIDANISSPWFDELFGQQAVLGILPLVVDSGEKPTQELLKRALVLITKPRQPATLLDSLGKMLLKDIDITTETVEGHDINRATDANGQSFFYTVAHGLAIIGLDPDPVVACLDRDLEKASEGNSGLVDAPAYHTLQTALNESQGTRFQLYLDFDASLNWAREAAPRLGADEDDMAEFEEGMQYLAGLHALGMVWGDDGKLVRQKTRVLYTPEKVHPMMGGSLGIAPEVNPTLAMAPADPLFYSWQNTMELTRLWETVTASEEFPREDQIAFQEEFEKWTGAALEDVLAAMGPQVAWVLNDLSLSGFFPLPELAVTVQSAQPKVVTQLLTRLTDRIGVPLEMENGDGYSIAYAQTPMGEDLSPAFACTKGYCTLATSRTFLRAVLASTEGGGLADNPKYQAVAPDAGAPANQAGFLDVERVMAKAKDVIKWSASMAAMAKQDNAAKITYLLNQIVYPIMDSLAQYPALGMQGTIGEDYIDAAWHLQKPVAAE